MIERGRALWARHRTALRPTIFLGGVLWDYLTLRIERTLDHLLLLAYFAGLLAVFAVQLRMERGRWVPGALRDKPWALEFAASFCMGALLSALGIAVLRATHPGPAALFIGVLAGLALANEVGAGAMRGVAMRFAMVGFLGFQLVSLVTPILFSRLVGVGWGLLGAAAATGALLYAAERGKSRKKSSWARDRLVPIASAAGGVAALLALIQLGVVPPLPLVLREAVLARDVTRSGEDYVLVEPHRRPALFQLLLGPPQISWAPGQSVAVYTAVFAPPAVDLVLYAVWEHYDPEHEAWVRTDRIAQSMQGGRSAGWRSWTRKRHVQTGSWRVRVETEQGREVGRIRFEIAQPEPLVESEAPVD